MTRGRDTALPPPQGRWRPRAVAAALWTIPGAALAYGLGRAIALAWVSDDAFISYRYARNMLRGLGLVYNPGERVEGYTNFLWTLLCGGGMALGADPVVWSQTLGIMSFAGVIAALVLFWWRTAPAGAGRAAVPPLAAAAFAVHHHCQVFATGGLETMAFTFLVVAAFVTILTAVRPRDWLVPGLFLTLATMMRPDGAVFYLAAAAWSVLEARRRAAWRPVAWMIAPAVLLYAPYFLWRLHYYGHLFPNTYYAKSAGLANHTQGLRYIGLFFRAYYVLLLVPVVLAVTAALSLRRRPALPKRRGEQRDEAAARGVWLAVLMAAAYIYFVVRVGGDFMFGRFLVPVVPFLYVVLEAFARRIRRPGLGWGLAACVWGLTLAPRMPAGLSDLSSWVVEEREFYPRHRVEEARSTGEHLSRYLSGTSAQVVIYGSQAMLAYYADFPFAIEGHAGLTDEYIARLPLADRSRPGHEKRAPQEYLLRRGVNFVFSFGLYRLRDRGHPLTRIDMGGVEGRILVYDRRLMDHLARFPEVRFTSFELFLDEYIGAMASLPRDQVREDFRRFREFYFAHNHDPAREAPFLSHLRR